MANEATLMIETSLPVNYKCDDGTGIEKGSVLKLADPMTVSASTAQNDYVAGICNGEKIASNGTVYCGVYLDGFFEMTASGNITAGAAVMTSSGGNNKVSAASASTGCKTLGIAQETATDGERIIVRLMPGANL